MNGDKSWELYRDTTLFETVDWVNSEGYRSYHELEGEEVLHYAVFVTVKERAEGVDDSSESGQEDEYDDEDESDDEESVGRAINGTADDAFAHLDPFAGLGGWTGDQADDEDLFFGE